MEKITFNHSAHLVAYAMGIDSERSHQLQDYLARVVPRYVEERENPLVSDVLTLASEVSETEAELAFVCFVVGRAAFAPVSQKTPSITAPITPSPFKLTPVGTDGAPLYELLGITKDRKDALAEKQSVNMFDLLNSRENNPTQSEIIEAFVTPCKTKEELAMSSYAAGQHIEEAASKMGDPLHQFLMAMEAADRSTSGQTGQLPN